jgi:malate dehydrogenase (oxaloacetate-decarboxylating)(NADP+)
VRNGQGERSKSFKLHGYMAHLKNSIVIQFEDFKNPFPALARYRDTFTCFNNDIQGTGSAILAGIINAMKKTGIPVKDQRVVLFGAGSTGVSVAKQIADFFVIEGLTEDEARGRFWLVDTKVKDAIISLIGKP